MVAVNSNDWSATVSVARQEQARRLRSSLTLDHLSRYQVASP
jgi:hypothetical protein